MIYAGEALVRCLKARQGVFHLSSLVNAEVTSDKIKRIDRAIQNNNINISKPSYASSCLYVSWVYEEAAEQSK